MNAKQLSDLFGDPDCFFAFEVDTCLSDEQYRHCKFRCRLKEQLKKLQEGRENDR